MNFVYLFLRVHFHCLFSSRCSFFHFFEFGFCCWFWFAFRAHLSRFECSLFSFAPFAQLTHSARIILVWVFVSILTLLVLGLFVIFVCIHIKHTHNPIIQVFLFILFRQYFFRLHILFIFVWSIFRPVHCLPSFWWTFFFSFVFFFLFFLLCPISAASSHSTATSMYFFQFFVDFVSFRILILWKVIFASLLKLQRFCTSKQRMRKKYWIDRVNVKQPTVFANHSTTTKAANGWKEYKKKRWEVFVYPLRPRIFATHSKFDREKKSAKKTNYNY